MYSALETLRTGFLDILDTILPLRGRTARTKQRSITEIPLSPTTHDLLGLKITTLMDYQDPAVEDLIRSLKYDGSGYAAHLCASLLADYLREEIANEKNFSTRNIMIVPVPLHRSRVIERGYNQIGIVLDHLPAEFKDGTLTTLAPEIITRVRETKPQTKLPRQERLSNVAGAFQTSDPEALQGAHVFLVDDVTTTGATLANAAQPIRRAGTQVTLLALARA